MINIPVFRRAAAVSAAAAFLASAPATAETYLSFEGAPSDRVEVETVSFSVSRAPEYDFVTGMTKKPEVYSTTGGPLMIGRALDSASPVIVDSVAKGRTIPTLTVRIEDTKDTGAGGVTVWTLKDAVLNNYSIYQIDQDITENFEISYTEATMAYYALNQTTSSLPAKPTSSVTWTQNPPYEASSTDIEQ